MRVEPNVKVYKVVGELWVPVAEGTNLVVTEGLEAIANRFTSATPYCRHVSLGTDNTAVTASDIALGSEGTWTGYSRDYVAAVAGVPGERIQRAVWTNSSGTDWTGIYESGVHTTAGGGDLCARVVFDNSFDIDDGEVGTVLWRWLYANS
jgi:hypothetical protein